MSNRVRKHMALSWMIIGLMLIISMFWVHNSHTRVVNEGPTIVILFRSHGVHPLDIGMLVIQGILSILLSKVLSKGFTANS